MQIFMMAQKCPQCNSLTTSLLPPSAIPSYWSKGSATIRNNTYQCQCGCVFCPLSDDEIEKMDKETNKKLDSSLILIMRLLLIVIAIGSIWITFDLYCHSI